MELIVVVAILSILTAIGANSYQAQVRRSRQQEAKVALSAIYAGEMSFFTNYYAFVPSLDAIGYVPPTDRNYWHAACANDTWSGTITNYSGVTTTQTYPPTTNVNPYLGNFAGSTCVHRICSTIGNNPQEIYAISSGQQISGGVTDSWEIDHNKKLTNCSLGI